MKIGLIKRKNIILALLVLVCLMAGCTYGGADGSSQPVTGIEAKQPAEAVSVEEWMLEQLPQLSKGEGYSPELFERLPDIDWKKFSEVSQEGAFELIYSIASLELSDKELACVMKATGNFDMEMMYPYAGVIHRMYFNDKKRFVKIAGSLETEQIKRISEILAESYRGPLLAMLINDTKKLLETDELTEKQVEVVNRIIIEFSKLKDPDTTEIELEFEKPDTLEKQIYKALSEAPGKKENIDMILSKIQNINWHEYSQLGLYNWEKLMMWLRLVNKDEDRHIINIMKATKGLDGALSESYSGIVGNIFMGDKRMFVKCASQLEEKDLEVLCNYTAYYCGYYNLNIIGKDTKRLLDEKALSDKEKHVIECLLDAIKIHQ